MLVGGIGKLMSDFVKDNRGRVVNHHTLILFAIDMSRENRSGGNVPTKWEAMALLRRDERSFTPIGHGNYEVRP